MPSLPTSVFYDNSFVKYYNIEWSSEASRLNNGCLRCCTNRHPMLSIDIIATIIFSVVLLIPLHRPDTHSDSSDHLSTPLYVTSNAIYTALSFYPIQLIFANSLPNVSITCMRPITYILIPLITIITATTLYAFYSPNRVDTHMANVAKTLGPTIQAIIIWTYYLFASCVLMSLHINYDPKRTVEVTSTALRCQTGASAEQLRRDTPETVTNESDPNLKIPIYAAVQATPSSYDDDHSSNLLRQLGLPVPTYDSRSGNNDPYFLRIPNDMGDYRGKSGEEKASESGEMHFVNNIPLQLFLCSVLLALVTATYYWVLYLTFKWAKTAEHQSNDDSTSLPTTHNLDSILLYYPTYWAVLHIARFVIKRIARLIDKNKFNEISVEVLMEFLISCFYYVFYRNLFLHISSVSNFIAIKVVHICMEVISYPFRMTHFYYRITANWQSNLKYKTQLHPIRDSSFFYYYCLRPILIVVIDETPYQLWCIRISIDYCSRYLTSVGSGIAYIIGALWTKYGYNNEFYSLGDISNAQFRKALIFVSCGVALEFIIYTVIDLYLCKALKVEFKKHWQLMIGHRPQYFIYFVFVLQHVFTDVFIAKLNVS